MADICRYQDWHDRLNLYLSRSISRAAMMPGSDVEWGNFDCCTFAFGAVREITGFDPMQRFRGQYCSKKEAMVALRNLGSGTLYKTTCSILGGAVHPAFSTRGDVAYYDNCCGVVNGYDSLFLTDSGISRMPTLSVQRVWKIG